MYKYKRFSKCIVASILIIFLAGCSSYSTTNENEPYIPNDEISEGPGIFSGQKGAFYLVGNNKAVTTTNNNSKQSMNSKQTINAINEKLEQLNRDRMELEAFKRRLK